MEKRPLPVSNAIELRRRNHELSILNAIASALNSSVELDQALQTGLAQVAELLGLHTGWLWLINEETGKTYLAASQNLPPALQNNPRRMKGVCHCLDTYLEGDLEGAANVNVLTCSRLSGLVDGTDGLRYHASIPLYARGKKMGVLNVASTDWRELSPDDLRLLYTIGDLLSIAIERSRLFARSAQISIVEERNRLAREIHDTLAQGFTGIILQLEGAEQVLSQESYAELAGAALEHIDKARSLARNSLQEARRSVWNLLPGPLERDTLDGAIYEAVKELGTESDVEAGFACTGDPVPLSVEAQTCLLRVAQEALANARKHAGARHVDVTLAYETGGVALTIRDDGQGFDPTAPRPAGQGGGFGLIGMRERCQLANGVFTLESAPGQGTVVHVFLWLRKPLPLGED